MVAAFFFIIVALIFYVIYESVLAENREMKDKLEEEGKNKN